VDERIAYGFCGSVDGGSFKGLDLTLKLCDVYNNKAGVKSMKKQVQIYKMLSFLQGTFIPPLHFFGDQWGLYIIATGYIAGVHPDKSELSKKEIQRAGQIWN
jgi:hypothetical protein